MVKRRLNQFKHENVGMLELTSIGITLALAICIGAFGGKWLGGKLGNETVGLLIGFGMGVTAGFMEMFRGVARWNRQLEHQEKQKPEQQNAEERQAPD